MRSVLLIVVTLLLSGSGQAQTSVAERLIARGQADSARAVLNSTATDAASRYWLGRLSEVDGQAKRHFREVTRQGGVHADDAHFQLAESAYSDPRGLYLTARRTYQSLIEAYPNSPHYPMALYRIGRTYQIAARPGSDGFDTQLDSARVNYQKVLDSYPGSHIAPHATVALVTLDQQAVGDRETQATTLPAAPLWGGDVSTFEAAGRMQKETPAAGAFWVQVGSFSTRSSVDAIVKRLTGSVPSVRLVDGGNLTRVQVGPYETKDQAERSGRHISRVEKLKCRVVSDG